MKSAPDSALIPAPTRPTAALALPSPTGLVPVPMPDPELLDGYLRLASHILLKSKQARIATIAVTSAYREEGRTTAALNLAICLGRTHGGSGRILLVDGDTKTRALSEQLGGLPYENAESKAAPFLLVTRFKGVDLMTAPMNDDALSLHDPDTWAQTLDALASRYRFVLVDCPPLLASPDGLVTPACADETVLIVRAGRTTRETVSRAVTMLPRPPLATVLNGGSGGNGRVEA